MLHLKACKAFLCSCWLSVMFFTFFSCMYYHLMTSSMNESSISHSARGDAINTISVCESLLHL